MVRRSWKVNVNLHDVWHRYDDQEGDLTAAQITEIGRECAERLRRSGWLELVAEDEYHRDELLDLFGELAESTSVDELDSTMASLWDEADEDRVWLCVAFPLRSCETS